MQDNLEVVAAPLFFALLVGSGLVWATVIRRLFRRQPLVELEPRVAVPWSGIDLVVLAMTLLFCEIAAGAVAVRVAGASSGGMSPKFSHLPASAPCLPLFEGAGGICHAELVEA